MKRMQQRTSVQPLKRSRGTALQGKGQGAKHHKSPSTTSNYYRVSPILDGPFEVWVILPGLPCAGKNNNQQRDTTDLSQSWHNEKKKLLTDNKPYTTSGNWEANHQALEGCL